MYLHKELETLTRPEIEKLQLERLQKTVRHCMNSAFYKSVHWMIYKKFRLLPNKIYVIPIPSDWHPYLWKKQSAFTHPVEPPETPLSFSILRKTLTNGPMQSPVVFIW